MNLSPGSLQSVMNGPWCHWRGLGAQIAWSLRELSRPAWSCPLLSPRHWARNITERLGLRNLLPFGSVLSVKIPLPLGACMASN